jgi:uncharacterized membrane protein YeaQ/YmgE (transglycosylase-associated protein family)
MPLGRKATEKFMAMNIILWVVLGGIAGWIASMVTDSNRSILGDIILGVLGAIIGGWVVALVGGQGITGFNLPSLIVAILGSIVLIWISRAFRSSTTNV